MAKQNVDRGNTKRRRSTRGQTPDAETWDRPRLDRALADGGAELSTLIDDLTRVIRARVGLALTRSGAPSRCGEARFETADLTQDILMRLFASDAGVLRRWDPAKGLSLRNFAGLVAQRHVYSVLRRQRLHRESALPADQLGELEAAPARTIERLEASQELTLLLAELRTRISAKAMRTVELVHLQRRTVPEACEALGTTPNALYVACTRIRKQIALIASELEDRDASEVFAEDPKGATRPRAIAA